MNDKRSLHRHEKLTLAVNRKAALQFLTEALAKSKIDDSHVCLIILDIRDFRELNHSFGEECGDAILQAIYKRLLNVCQSGAEVYYLGNDEFCIAVEALPSAGIAVLQAEAALAIFKEIFEWNNHSLKITVNSGIAYNYEAHQDANQLLYDAEIALRQAKSLNLPYQTLGQQDQLQGDRLKWELLESLHTAIEDDELSLYYQAKSALQHSSNGRPTPHGAEALIRWQNESHGLISPARTLPLIEHLGSELDILRWLINTALKNLQAEGGQHPVSINVPAKSVSTPELLQVVTAALELWPVEASMLTLEITEDALIEDKEKAFDTLSKIRELGVRIALDDFGTGYSSLAYFKHIPADELKIDRAFIKGMNDNDDDRKIVKLIIDLAHSFDLSVVAEGVEDQQTIELLRALGCDYIQGYVIAKPMPYSSYLNWLASQ